MPLLIWATSSDPINFQSYVDLNASFRHNRKNVKMDRVDPDQMVSGSTLVSHRTYVTSHEVKG